MFNGDVIRSIFGVVELDMEENKKEVFRISVRNLVEFILRSGDIDARRGGFADKEAMAKGSRIHRKIQKKMGGHYQAEVPLFHETVYDEIIIRVEGEGFLYNMVRIISGTLIKVGLHAYPPEHVKTILESADRTLAGETVPAQGLFLKKIEYL